MVRQISNICIISNRQCLHYIHENNKLMSTMSLICIGAPITYKYEVLEPNICLFSSFIGRMSLSSSKGFDGVIIYFFIHKCKRYLICPFILPLNFLLPLKECFLFKFFGVYFHKFYHHVRSIKPVKGALVCSMCGKGVMC